MYIYDQLLTMFWASEWIREFVYRFAILVARSGSDMNNYRRRANIDA